VSKGKEFTKRPRAICIELSVEVVISDKVV